MPGDQNIPCVGVIFDGADGAPSKEHAPEYATSGTGEEREFSKSLISALLKCHAISLAGVCGYAVDGSDDELGEVRGVGDGGWLFLTC